MRKFYEISCLLLALITLAARVITLTVGAGGKSPTASRIGLWTVIGCLSLLTVMTVFCVCISPVGGRLTYKIGFYVLHCALIVLAFGFIVTEITTVKVNYFCALEKPAVSVSDTAAPKAALPSGELLYVTRTKTELYPDGSPKHYEADVQICDKSGVEKASFTLTVNHPARYEGRKIYLMGLTDMPDGSTAAALTFKYNPGEYPVLAGIAMLLCGTFLMCFSGFGGSLRGGKKDV